MRLNANHQFLFGSNPYASKGDVVPKLDVVITKNVKDRETGESFFASPIALSLPSAQAARLIAGGAAEEAPEEEAPAPAAPAEKKQSKSQPKAPPEG